MPALVAAQVDRDGAVPHLQVDVDDVGVPRHQGDRAGVDVRRVQAAVGPHGRGDQVPDGSVVGDVEPRGHRLAAEAGDGGGGLLGSGEVQVAHDDPRALARQLSRRGGADAGGGTRDQDDLVFQALHAVPPAACCK